MDPETVREVIQVKSKQIFLSPLMNRSVEIRDGQHGIQSPVQGTSVSAAQQSGSEERQEIRTHKSSFQQSSIMILRVTIGAKKAVLDAYSLLISKREKELLFFSW